MNCKANINVVTSNKNKFIHFKFSTTTIKDLWIDNGMSFLKNYPPVMEVNIIYYVKNQYQ